MEAFLTFFFVSIQPVQFSIVQQVIGVSKKCISIFQFFFKSGINLNLDKTNTWMEIILWDSNLTLNELINQFLCKVGGLLYCKFVGQFDFFSYF
jgi:hypothetical protein